MQRKSLWTFDFVYDFVNGGHRVQKAQQCRSEHHWVQQAQHATAHFTMSKVSTATLMGKSAVSFVRSLEGMSRCPKFVGWQLLLSW